MEEYRQKFEELCVHMDNLTDREKKEMFFLGLKDEYRQSMGFYNFPTYRDVVEAALRQDSQYVQPYRHYFSGYMGKRRENDGNR